MIKNNFNLNVNMSKTILFTHHSFVLDLEYTYTRGDLQVGTKTTAALQQMLKDLEGLPPTNGKTPCNHLSVYRRRGADKQEAKERFEKVQKALANHHWGILQGVSERIKLVGTAYDECRVLAGV
jgi:hypothetical protein